MRAPAVGLVSVPAKGFPSGLPAWQKDGDGYTWWDGASCDPLITSHVARAMRGLDMSHSVKVIVEDKHTHLCLSCPLSVCYDGRYKCPISASRRTAHTSAPGAMATILAMPGRHGAEKKHAGEKCWVFGVTEYGHIAAETSDGDRIGYHPWQIKMLDPMPPSSATKDFSYAALADIAHNIIRKKTLTPRALRKLLGNYSSDADVIQQAISSLFENARIKLVRRSYPGGVRYKVFEYAAQSEQKEQAQPHYLRTQKEVMLFVESLLANGKVRSQSISNKLNLYTQDRAVARKGIAALLAAKVIKETRPRAADGCSYRMLELV